MTRAVAWVDNLVLHIMRCIWHYVFWNVIIVEILKHFIMITWGVNMVEKSTVIINMCRIHRLSRK